MNARKTLLIAMLFGLAITAVACAQPTAEPTKVLPTLAPPATDAPKPTTAPTAAPTVAPTIAPAAFDVKPVLDKYITNLPDGFSTIAPAALKDQMAAAKPFILDVREASEIAQNGFIEGSVNIPIRSLTKNLDRLPAKDQPIVTLCASGHRGAMAMETLQMLGYTNVKSLLNGFNGWKAANLPVATGAPAAPVAGKAPEVDKDLFAALDKYLTNLPDGFGAITPAGLKDQLATAKPFLLDTREPKELTDNGLIEGAVNVPIRTLTKNLNKLPAKDQPIVVYCSGGHRGALAMQTLQLLGYTNVKNIAGGFNAWKTANLPVAGGTPAATAKTFPMMVTEALAQVPTISPADASQVMKSNPDTLVIDVRDAADIVATGIIPGAVNISLGTLTFKADNQVPPEWRDAKLANRSRQIITVCYSGEMGALAAKLLKDMGFTNVSALKGGTVAWKAAGYATK